MKFKVIGAGLLALALFPPIRLSQKVEFRFLLGEEAAYGSVAIGHMMALSLAWICGVWIISGINKPSIHQAKTLGRWMIFSLALILTISFSIYVSRDASRDGPHPTKQALQEYEATRRLEETARKSWQLAVTDYPQNTKPAESINPMRPLEEVDLKY